MNLFEQRLLTLFSQRGIKQKDLAAGVGLSPAAIHNYLNGAMPGAAELAKLADYFGVTTDWLLGREKGPKPAGLSEAPPGHVLDDVFAAFEELKENVSTLERGLKRLKQSQK